MPARCKVTGTCLLPGCSPAIAQMFYNLPRSLRANLVTDCRGLQSYQWLQAMVFAVEEINRSPTLLPNVTLGFRIHDSCMMMKPVLEGTFWMLSERKLPIPNYRCLDKKPLAGIVGDTVSPHSVQMARVLGLYRYPQDVSVSAPPPRSWKVPRGPRGGSLEALPHCEAPLGALTRSAAAGSGFRRSHGGAGLSLVDGAEPRGRRPGPPDGPLPDGSSRYGTVVLRVWGFASGPTAVVLHRRTWRLEERALIGVRLDQERSAGPPQTGALEWGRLKGWAPAEGRGPEDWTPGYFIPLIELLTSVAPQIFGRAPGLDCCKGWLLGIGPERGPGEWGAY
ncbi:hypothetical protein NDU88_000630 [Pleurodeles waltl]|uniref:Receptor ligand binding region domain-containing protein n=1 Tax=Pleurodeles waltl TaxID=8319 RepID=A0AAV7KNV2_PLEWA|nr:hypothetical protein NDU88_000630 [Pleurodeles waltl]